MVLQGRRTLRFLARAEPRCIPARPTPAPTRTRTSTRTCNATVPPPFLPLPPPAPIDPPPHTHTNTHLGRPSACPLLAVSASPPSPSNCPAGPPPEPSSAPPSMDSTAPAAAACCMAMPRHIAMAREALPRMRASKERQCASNCRRTCTQAAVTACSRTQQSRVCSTQHNDKSRREGRVHVG